MKKVSILAILTSSVFSLVLGACIVVANPNTPPPAGSQPPPPTPGRTPFLGNRVLTPTPATTPTPTATATTTLQKMTGSNMFGSQAGSATALKGTVYWVNANTTALPDFDKLTPITQLYAEVLNTPAREFTEGFPGVDAKRVEWFGIRYAGNFTVATAGDYTFKLVARDGAKAYIDGNLVVDNDGAHAVQSRTGVAKLTTGGHTLRVDYFLGTKGQAAIQLLVTGPDKVEKPWLPAF
jgi:hypothetical protein